MEPKNEPFDPSKIRFTFGPYYQYGVAQNPLTDREVNKIARALEEMAAGFETQMELEAMDLLEADVQASDYAQARQMLDQLFKSGS